MRYIEDEIAKFCAENAATRGQLDRSSYQAGQGNPYANMYRSPSADAKGYNEELWTDFNARQVEAAQRRMLKVGLALALSILIGIGLGIELERGWTAINAEAVEVVK